MAGVQTSEGIGERTRSGDTTVWGTKPKKTDKGGEAIHVQRLAETSGILTGDSNLLRHPFKQRSNETSSLRFSGYRIHSPSRSSRSREATT